MGRQSLARRGAAMRARTGSRSASDKPRLDSTSPKTRRVRWTGSMGGRFPHDGSEHVSASNRNNAMKPTGHSIRTCTHLTPASRHAGHSGVDIVDKRFRDLHSIQVFTILPLERSLENGSTNPVHGLSLRAASDMCRVMCSWLALADSRSFRWSVTAGDSTRATWQGLFGV